MRTLLPTLLLLLAFAPQSQAGRTTVSLDGCWEIADSAEAYTPPPSFTHTVPVPGLANLPQPTFENVDSFYSREHLANCRRITVATAAWVDQLLQD